MLYCQIGQIVRHWKKINANLATSFNKFKKERDENKTISKNLPRSLNTVFIWSYLLTVIGNYTHKNKGIQNKQIKKLNLWKRWQKKLYWLVSYRL